MLLKQNFVPSGSTYVKQLQYRSELSNPTPLGPDESRGGECSEPQAVNIVQ
jgi:hypothetical protein